MELLSVEYGDTVGASQQEWEEGVIPAGESACLQMVIAIDPNLLAREGIVQRTVEALAPLFPAARDIVLPGVGEQAEPEIIARATGLVVLDLQRDLCEWPGARHMQCRATGRAYEYELCVESIDERVGRFAAQLAVQVVRMMLLDEQFDPRLTWVIDLVRRLRRQPRLRLNPKRVAAELGCSRSSAEWAIGELERYGYILIPRARRIRRSQGGRILVVDDSAQIRDLMTRMLEALGYDVITALDGEEGLILLDWSSYKAVFVDVKLPFMDGLTFLKRAREQGVQCPIFVISAYDHLWGVKEMRAKGATDYITKPFSMAEIEDVIDRYLK